MRVTVHLPDKLAKEIKALAADEGVSVSRFIARSLEHYITENRKKKHAKKILEMVGKVHVSDEALQLLEEGRVDNRI